MKHKVCLYCTHKRCETCACKTCKQIQCFVTSPGNCQTATRLRGESDVLPGPRLTVVFFDESTALDLSNVSLPIQDIQDDGPDMFADVQLLQYEPGTNKE